MSKLAPRWSEADLATILSRRSRSPVVADGELCTTPRRSKYGSRRTVVDGIAFDSKREAERYAELKLLRQGGRVLWFIMQVPFRLPGGTRWYADFLVVWATGSITVEDTKGFKTETYRVKKREVEAAFGIEITEL